VFKMNKNLKTILLICLLAWSFYAFACEKKVVNPPSESQIKQWWKSKGNEDIDILQIIPIKLMNKEDAFIAQVYFTGRGRNFFNGALLVRPMLKEAREIDDVIGATEDAFEVTDFDNDGVSEIVAKAVGSGQGTTSGAKYLIRFEGWNSVILHKSEFGDNLGACGEYSNQECYSTKVYWHFDNINGNALLVETTITEEGLEAEKLESKKIVKSFLFKKGKLLPYEVQDK
jgi:hypothetical protein